ncbi:MAG TPA: acetamidase/formamidase family protein [Roseiflexaceae bacterium]|nr:acetamidase/formamidase family protein [Roseiflexaceae bacterium]
MPQHVLEPDEQTLHGYFSPEMRPILTIDSGDSVRLRTLDAGWGLEPPSLDRAPRRKFPSPANAPLQGHALCGPIAVRGAEPGKMLAVQLELIQPDTWGWTWAGGWSSDVNQHLGVADGDQHLLLWSLDPAALIGRNQYGHTVQLRPFLGIIGMPPPEPGAHSTWPPRVWGGNLDCKELIVGSTLFLPISVSGALLSVGDGHAAQGDGEVSSMAIECPMERVELTIQVRDDISIAAPHAKTPAGWVTFGFNEDLKAATLDAITTMVELLSTHYHLHRKDALALASVVVDVHITQIVNGVCGVHAILPEGAIK